jgi:nucleotide-binding universal stress UspA family protein
MSHPFQRILLTTDLSDDARRAFDQVAALARDEEAQVTLFHVVHDVIIPPPAGVPVATPLHAPEVDRKRAEAQERLQELAAAHFTGLATDAVAIVATSAAEAIADHAHQHGFDLIAMSTHGRSGFRRLVLGSVAEAVLRHAEVPVLLFPKPPR